MHGSMQQELISALLDQLVTRDMEDHLDEVIHHVFSPEFQDERFRGGCHHWSVHQVYDWLKSLKLGGYNIGSIADRIRDEQVDGSVLMEVTEEEWAQELHLDPFIYHVIKIIISGWVMNPQNCHIHFPDIKDSKYGVRVGTIADLTECNVAAALMMIDVDNLCKSCGIGGIYGKLTVLGHKEYMIRKETAHPLGAANDSFTLRRRKCPNGMKEWTMRMLSPEDHDGVGNLHGQPGAGHPAYSTGPRIIFSCMPPCSDRHYRAVDQHPHSRGQPSANVYHPNNPPIHSSDHRGGRGGGVDAANLSSSDQGCNVLLELHSDPLRDVFQIGRAALAGNDFVIPGVTHVDELGLKTGAVSRWACRIECDRLPPFHARIYAGGFAPTSQCIRPGRVYAPRPPSSPLHQQYQQHPQSQQQFQQQHQQPTSYDQQGRQESLSQQRYPARQEGRSQFQSPFQRPLFPGSQLEGRNDAALDDGGLAGAPHACSPPPRRHTHTIHDSDDDDDNYISNYHRTAGLNHGTSANPQQSQGTPVLAPEPESESESELGSWLASVDGFTTFGIRILQPEVGHWVEVSVRGRVYQPAVAFCAAPHTRLAPSDAHAATGTTPDHHRYYDRQHEHHHRPQHNQQQQHGGQQQMQQGHAQGHAGHGLVEGTEEGTEPLLLGNILTDGTIIDIFGTLLLYSSPVSMARNVQVGAQSIVRQLNALGPLCPVLFNKLSFSHLSLSRHQRSVRAFARAADADTAEARAALAAAIGTGGDRGAGGVAMAMADTAGVLPGSGSGGVQVPTVDYADLKEGSQPYVFPACGHVFGYHASIRGRPCPLCRKRGPFVPVAFSFEPLICSDIPTHVFNPCGHIASRATCLKWASTPVFSSRGVLNPDPQSMVTVCPYCTTQLRNTGSGLPFSKLTLQTEANDEWPVLPALPAPAAPVVSDTLLEQIICDSLLEQTSAHHLKIMPPSSKDAPDPTVGAAILAGARASKTHAKEGLTRAQLMQHLLDSEPQDTELVETIRSQLQLFKQEQQALDQALDTAGLTHSSQPIPPPPSFELVDIAAAPTGDHEPGTAPVRLSSASPAANSSSANAAAAVATAASSKVHHPLPFTAKRYKSFPKYIPQLSNDIVY